MNKDQIKIVATCDIWSYNRELGAKLIDDTDLSVYVDYKEMLDKEELDAVLIATPLYMHYQMVMDCLDAGLYVFCEKTMTMTIEESRNIVRKCNETGKFVQIGHQRHYNPYYNRSEEHTSELQSRRNLVCRLLLEKKKNNNKNIQ